MNSIQIHNGRGDNIGGDKKTRAPDSENEINWSKWGVILAIIGIILSIMFSKNIQQSHNGIGDNVVGDKIVQERKLFSDTQSIKVLPPRLGGRDFLDLDGVARLKFSVPSSSSTITTLLDIVPMSLPDKKEEGFSVEGTQVFNHSLGEKYVFDTGENKRHQIPVGGRTFVVTLFGVHQLQVENVSNAIEYEFGISEQ